MQKLKSPSRLVRILIAIAVCCALYIIARRTYLWYRRVAKLPSTLSVLMTLSGLAANWEMWTLANNKPGDSFSATIFKLARDQTFIAFAYGMTGRHLFGGDPKTKEACEAGYEAGKFWPLLDKDDLQETN